MSKPPLREFQRENVDWIQRVRRGLLADEPGLGKSRSALEGVSGAGRVLIVAPNLVAKSGVWHEEVEKWGDDDTKYHLATYSMLNERRHVKGRKNPIPVKVVREQWKGHWDAVIFDEAHYIKGRNTLWTDAALKIADNADMFLALTGTPIPNWSHEIFTVLQAIHYKERKRGQRLGAFWRWAEEWFDTSPSEFSGGKPSLGALLECGPRCMSRDPSDPCDHYLLFAEHNLGDRYMRHMRKDHLDLPPIDYVDIATPMAHDARQAYTELRQDFATRLAGESRLAWSQGALNVMLDKITTSPWLLHKTGEPRGGKFDTLESDLIAREGQPTLVLAHYRDTVEACVRIAERLGLSAAPVHGGTSDEQDTRSITQFKAGKLNVLVGSLETLAEGLTLTIANEAIFVERSFKPSRNEQATYRIYRMGQDQACTIRRYITPRSVDWKKEKMLKTKNDHQMRTLTAADFYALT